MLRNCTETYQYICENLDQDMDSPRCRQIRKHLEVCPDCRAYLDSLKKTVHLYQLVPAPKLSRSAHRTLVKKIDVVLASSTRPGRTRKRKHG